MAPPTLRATLLSAVASAVALVLVWVGTYRVDFISWFDRGVQSGFIGLDDTRIGAWAHFIVRLADPLPFALMSLALIGVALLRRRPRHALMAAAILGGANVTTQVLKRLTEGPRAYDVTVWPGGLGSELWPSGHTTAAMTLALCLVLVVPRRGRPVAAAVGGWFAVAMVYSLMVLAWHLPSDSVGGFFVATGWTFGVLTLARLAERRWPAPTRREPTLGPVAVLWPVLAVSACAAVVVLGVAASRPGQARGHAIEHTAFVLGAPLLGLLALTLAGAVALSLRR